MTLLKRAWASSSSWLLHDQTTNPLAIRRFHRASAVMSSEARKRADTMTIDSARTSLNGFGVFAIIVFACVSLIVIRPLKIPITKGVAKVLRKYSRKIWKAIAGLPDGNRENSSTEEGREEEETPMYLIIDHIAAPVIGVLVLLATTTIGGEQVKQGIVGEDGIEPYDVLALFISLAYIAISLDATGLLRFLAFMICIKAGRQGREAKGKTLFLLLYFFFWSAGVLVGNDPVILSGTAFLVYFTRVAGISPPDAWIWAEFVAANISSAVLVSSNPTNLVIASGFDVDFITYTAYMVLPAFGSAVGGLIAILLFFRNQDGSAAKGKRGTAQSSSLRKLAEAVPVLGQKIRGRVPQSQLRQRPSHTTSSADGRAVETDGAPGPQKKKQATPLIYIPETIIRPDVDPRAALVDKWGAIFGSIVMAATLATLVGTSVIGGVKVFEIAVPGAVLCLTRDAVADYLQWRKEKLGKTKPKDEMESTSNGQHTARNEASSTEVRQVEAIEMNTFESKRGDLEPTRSDCKATSRDENSLPQIKRTTTQRSQRSSEVYKSKNPIRKMIRVRAKLADVFPTVTIVLSRLPFPLLPFAFSMFILVQALAHVGFINIMAKGLGKVCSAGFVPTAFFISFLGVVLCNIGGTNIGATILLTKAVRSPYFTEQIAQLSSSDQELITKVAQYSIAFGSNVGALGGTFAASLAGLLWLSGLKQGGITVRARQFLVWCLVVIVPSTVIGIGIIIAEVRYFHVGS